MAANRVGYQILPASACAILATDFARAEETRGSFAEEFANRDNDRWRVSDGWSNGDHQNCVWYISLWASDTLTSWLATFPNPSTPVFARISWVIFTAEGTACQFPESVARSLQ
ncbi:hypothetical protein B5P45_22465 [Phyllobacterium zundukense]|uniref:Uncharacterized protein n=1 Tax=Phyllobacterium zundukense TaxID=1867719 RepID=A0A2N9VQS7_9HYPH|nr:hypothetical protein BLM14_12025 [Phyllobacterium zundukense]PIO41845.1 hypothetical protein B5P45_22465 [Phyllobacterium zundukense]